MGNFGALFAVGGAIDLVGEGAAALRDDDLALLQELVGHVDGFVEEAAGVAAEIEDEAVEIARTEVVERVADFVAGGLDKAGDVDVADAGTDQEGEIDGGTRNLVADEVEDEGLGCAFAAHGDGDVGAAWAPLSSEATAAESMPSVDLPSMERITSPGRMPAL